MQYSKQLSSIIERQLRNTEQKENCKFHYANAPDKTLENYCSQPIRKDVKCNSICNIDCLLLVTKGS